jgi:hypothetical protein
MTPCKFCSMRDANAASYAPETIRIAVRSGFRPTEVGREVWRLQEAVLTLGLADNSRTRGHHGSGRSRRIALDGTCADGELLKAVAKAVEELACALVIGLKPGGTPARSSLVQIDGTLGGRQGFARPIKLREPDPQAV